MTKNIELMSKAELEDLKRKYVDQYDENCRKIYYEDYLNESERRIIQVELTKIYKLIKNLDKQLEHK